MSNEKQEMRIGDGRYIDIRIDLYQLHKAFFSICAGARTPGIEDAIVLAYHVCRESTVKATEQARQDLALLMTVHVSEFDGTIKSSEPFSLQDEWNQFLTHGQGIDNEHKPDEGEGRGPK